MTLNPRPFDKSLLPGLHLNYTMCHNVVFCMYVRTYIIVCYLDDVYHYRQILTCPATECGVIETSPVDVVITQG